ncbi:MAG TPA: biotin-dependent carboxyltransferase family protein [Jatrophihabitans sp.]|nr:biotin-dependent carboxyltransferase family protein [Jatrophihabitans sp.]
MIEVIATGPLATVQDLGRPGHQHLGVGRSGAADQAAHRLANRLVGNPESAATVEITYGGLAVRLLAPATVAFTGARCAGVPGWGMALSLPAGSRLALAAPADRLRSYLAVRGGVAVAPVLGSRATDVLSGLGPAVLGAGDRLPVGTVVAGDPAGEPAPDVGPAGRPVRVVPGPRADWFRSPATLYDRPWIVQPASNRIGIRLAGRPLERSRAGELSTEPTLPGAIQVPPDGQPIVLFRDAPVTGGYPVIGVVAAADLDLLGQLRPGEPLRFVRTGS